MGIELERMRVVIEGESKQFAKEAKKAKAEAKALSDSVKKEMDNVRSSMEKPAKSSRMKEFQNMKNFIKEFRGNLSSGIKEVVEQEQLASGIKVHTDEYEQVLGDIERVEKSVESLRKKQRDLKMAGADEKSEMWRKLQDDIKKTMQDLKHYEELEREMVITGKIGSPKWKTLQKEMKQSEKKLEEYREKEESMNQSGFAKEAKDWERIGTEIATANRKLDGYITAKERMEGTGADVQYANTGGLSAVTNPVKASVAAVKATIREVLQDIPIIGRIPGIISKAFGGMAHVFKAVQPAIRKVSGAFGFLINKFASGIPVIRRLTNSQRSLHKSTNRLSGGIFKLGNMFKLMVLRMGIRAVIDGTKQGFQNLAQYSDSANTSMSMLMSSLTQLKNSFAAAFAPILNIVAPILDSFIQKIISINNAIGQLASALTGKGTFVRAKKVQQDYAKSLDKTKKSSDAAKRSLLGFDQINKLDDNSNGDSGELSPGDMFETVDVDSKFKSLSEKIKEAWRIADFTEIGQIVGNKINTALESIPWEKIRTTSSKIGRSIATFLNGAIDTADWNLVGASIANGLNTGLDFGYELATTFDWKKFGKSIADIINGAIKNFEWVKTATTISEFAKGLLDTIIQAIENTDWIELGMKVADFVGAIDWNGVVKRLCEGMGAALGGLVGFLVGLIADAWNDVVDWWYDTAYEDGNFAIEGLKKGILDAMKSIGNWIKDYIFQPFIDGFKRVFGIHSPSTVMAEQGRYIILGIMKGAKDKVVDLLEWFRELPSKIKNAIGSLYDLGKNVIKSFVDGFKSLDIPTPHFKVKGNVSIAGVDTPIPKLGVEWYAKGGFPNTGQMFVARESGPELVGRMGSRNAVANNNQIVEGIKAGVFEAVMDAFGAGNFFRNSSDEKNIFLEFTFKCDSETIFKMNRKGELKHNGRVVITEGI